MRSPGWLLRPLLLALAPLALTAAPGDQTQWKLSKVSWVKRVPAEPGTPPNAQPARLGADALQALLEPVRVRLEGGEAALFAKDELKALSKALSEALALAQPGEDLLLLSTSKRGGGFLETPLGLTARLFVAEGALHLIVHDARLSFMDRYLADGTLPKFAFGSRTEAANLSLQAPGAAGRRGDWLALPLPSPAPSTPVPGVVAPAPVPPPAPAPAANPKAAPEPTPALRDAAFYEAQTQRLKALKRMRDEGVLSEAEYLEKREAILKTL
ncbi:MAG: SHOCT domain-containing protein [Holophagaceae bacterium]|uniref:SHOCT domain-containing protein n=1 Tax=Candidatus Geothrix skivensis TaxID=2954439 RepID=A0A9D7SE95_9BACT|nr:SHOCT domain-containing protein [Candidatus Geothrix skivensis]